MTHTNAADAPTFPLVIEVPGTPRARPRARHGARIDTKTGKAYSTTYHPTKIRISKKTGKPTPDSLAWARAQKWYEDVRWAVQRLRRTEPLTGPIRVTVEVYFERPQRLLTKKSPEGPVWHTAKPDRDNTDKSILDAFTKAGLWLDDAQVCDGPVRKFYAAKGCGPGVRVIVEPLTGLPEFPDTPSLFHTATPTGASA